MKIQIDCDDIKLETCKYIDSVSTTWEVFPGALMAEKEVSTIEDLYDFMEECEKVEGKNLDFILRVLPPTKFDDDEKMMYMTISKVKPLI